MKEFEVAINDEHSIIVRAKKVTVKSDNTLIFYNPQSSVSAQYVYGSEVVATFNPGQYAYFHKMEF